MKFRDEVTLGHRHLACSSWTKYHPSENFRKKKKKKNTTKLDDTPELELEG